VPTAKFALWAKFDVSEEEGALLRRYRVANCYLTIEASRRDLWRAGVMSFFIAFISVGGLSAAFPSLPTTPVQTQRGMVQQYTVVPWWVWLLFMAIVFSIATWIIYEQLRLAIRVQDMLDGREFKNKSLVLHLAFFRAGAGFRVQPGL
jgi:hypothetical protein